MNSIVVVIQRKTCFVNFCSSRPYLNNHNNLLINE